MSNDMLPKLREWCDALLVVSNDRLKNGIDFLLKKQNEDGSFSKAYTAAAIDAGRYKIYSLVFSLIALAKYKKRCENGNNRD